MSKILQRIQLNNQSINIGFCPNVYLTNVFSIKQQRQNEVQVRQYFHSPIHKGTLRKMGKNLNLSVSLVQILRSTITTTNLYTLTFRTILKKEEEKIHLMTFFTARYVDR